MAEVMKNAEERQEYWRPAVDEARTREADRAMSMATAICENCGTDYAMGARFCHVCGSERDPRLGPSSRWRSGISRWLDIEVIKSGLGLTTGSVVFFFVGMICAIAGAVTGLIFSASTLLDWQAVQIWRVEWLLAATAAFAAGVLLKR
jgi:hypothetical protein